MSSFGLSNLHVLVQFCYHFLLRRSECRHSELVQPGIRCGKLETSIPTWNDERSRFKGLGRHVIQTLRAPAEGDLMVKTTKMKEADGESQQHRQEARRGLRNS